MMNPEQNGYPAWANLTFDSVENMITAAEILDKSEIMG